MAKIKYYYDTESCRYERIRVSTWDIIFNFLGFLMLALALGAGTAYVYTIYFESPEEALLRKENEELKIYYDLLSKEVDNTKNILETLQERDDNVYRIILGVDPVADEVRKAGFGGANRYKDLVEKGIQQEQLVISNLKKIDQLKKQMYVQTKSYDEVMSLAKDNQQMLASLPAIPPVAKEDLKRLSSGFGRRMHPIYKIMRPHNGIDFSLPKGSPVYATGNGKVSLVKSSPSGFGKWVEIDHGYGYKTIYAHLNEFLVKKGQKIKRGELIAYSGNSGGSTAAHLHYEVHNNRKPMDPAHYFYLDIDPEEYKEVLRLASLENQSFGFY